MSTREKKIALNNIKAFTKDNKQYELFMSAFDTSNKGIERAYRAILVKVEQELTHI